MLFEYEAGQVALTTITEHVECKQTREIYIQIATHTGTMLSIPGTSCTVSNLPSYLNGATPAALAFAAIV